MRISARLAKKHEEQRTLQLLHDELDLQPVIAEGRVLHLRLRPRQIVLCNIASNELPEISSLS